jgi:signal transduction histidine kinase
VKRRSTLEARIGAWFGVTLVALYGVVAVGLWASTRERGRQYAVLTLKSEAEAVAGYVGETGRTDAPELAEPELDPFPIWIRLVAGPEIVAATPGAPDVPAASPAVTTEHLYLRPPGASKPVLVVRHAVGGRSRRIRDELAVEAIGDLSALRRTEDQLAGGLALLGLVILPLAALGGRLLARRALRPLAGLVDEIEGLAAAGLDRRLGIPPRAVAEVATLAASFNDVLSRLETSIVAMRRFTADASQEIRNPLSVMRTGIEVALRRDRDAGEYRTLLAENLHEIVHLQATLEGLLALARSEPGQPPPIQRLPVDLSALAREACARFEAVAAELGSSLVAEIAPGLELVGDPNLLRLVLFNLLDNAFKHGPRGEAVRLAAERDAGALCLRVANGGAPIPPELRERIFDRFVRGAAERRDGAGGLGLSVVRWVAEAHGGAVRLLDGDEGTCFEVTLPATARA